MYYDIARETIEYQYDCWTATYPTPCKAKLKTDGFGMLYVLYSVNVDQKHEHRYVFFYVKYTILSYYVSEEYN